MGTRKKSGHGRAAKAAAPTSTAQGAASATGRTVSGRPVDVVVPMAARDAASYLEAIGFPDEPPYTRGIRATMYRGRLWTMREYAGFGTAEEANRRFRYLLAQGNEGLSIAFDLPTQMGYDSDSPMARGEVGRVGVAISSIEDMKILLDGLPLDLVSTSMTINATAPILLALYVSVAESRGIPRRAVRGTVQNDILKEYVARSTYIYPPEASIRLAIDVIDFCSREVPKWNAISVSGYHIREAGATAAQELAFTLANGIAYLQAAVERGLDADAIAPQVSFFFNAHMDLFEEVAKFRAARRLWGAIMRDRFHARKPESWALRFHAQTAGVALTAQQPENNAVRVAIQALAAILGSAQSVHTNSMDEAVDRRGGMPKAIESGWVQRQIADASYRFQLEVERGERTVVGVSAFAERGAPARAARRNTSSETRQIARVKAFRKGRDRSRTTRSLDRVREVAAGDGNLVPAILNAVLARATLGEISDALRDVFGTYRPREDV